MDEYGKAKDFLKTIQDVKSQYSQDSFEASVPDEFILSIATAETGNFKFEGADICTEELITILDYKL